MKSVFLAISLFAATNVFSQDTIQDQDELFIVLYTTGDSWDTSKEFYEQSYASEHSAHLAGLRELEKITLGGRYGDVGMIILVANDEADAQRIINEDPAVEGQIFNVEIHPFYTFYGGCVE